MNEKSSTKHLQDVMRTHAGASCEETLAALAAAMEQEWERESLRQGVMTAGEEREEQEGELWSACSDALFALLSRKDPPADDQFLQMVLAVTAATLLQELQQWLEREPREEARDIAHALYLQIPEEFL